MTDTTPTQASRNDDPKESEWTHQQLQEDNAGSYGSSAQRNHAGSSGQRPAAGRNPLFGT
jgi:hypothetical protein